MPPQTRSLCRDENTRNKVEKHPKHWSKATLAEKTFCSQPLTPSSSSEDFILFDQEEYETDDAPDGERLSPDTITPPEGLSDQILLRTFNHVIKPKATSSSMRRTTKDSDRFKCLTHISSRNCTSRCFNEEPFPRGRSPPPAPRPPRLPSPELSDFEGKLAFPDLESDCSKRCDDSLKASHSDDADLGKIRQSLTDLAGS